MSSVRKAELVNDSVYHIFSRSISGYIVFNNKREYARIIDLLNIYRYKDFNYQYSLFKRLSVSAQENIIKSLKTKNDTLVEIIAYCIMPTHFHLILRQTSKNGITKYIGKVLNSYSKYFNAKHKRVGPLWANRFKNVLVDDDDQLLHLTRYIHLNPTSANLTASAEEWEFSSYREYLKQIKRSEKICVINNLFDISAGKYKKFVDNRKDYQQELSLIKTLLIDDYSG